MSDATTPSVPDRLLTPAEVGAWVGLTPSALSQLRYKGTGPKYLKLSSKTVRYRETDVQAWIDASARQGTADDLR